MTLPVRLDRTALTATSLLLIPRWGLVGAAWGSVAGMLALTVAVGLESVAVLGLRPRLASVYPPYLAGAAAASILALMLVLLPAPDDVSQRLVATAIAIAGHAAILGWLAGRRRAPAGQAGGPATEHLC